MRQIHFEWPATRLYALWRLLTGQRVPRQSSRVWWWAEVRVRRTMERALADYLDLCERCDELGFQATQAITSNGLDVTVYHAHSSLIARTLTDLRATAQLAVSGYTMQSWSVAASCFEAAHSIGFIGNDRVRAKRWMEHAALDCAPWNAKDAVQNAIIFLALEADAKRRQALVDREYAVYETLCIAKHVNPVAEKYRYIYLREKSQVLRFSPVATQRRIREAKKGLIAAIRCTTTAIWALLHAHHRENEQLRQMLLEVMTTTDALVQELLPVSGAAGELELTGA